MYSEVFLQDGGTETLESDIFGVPETAIQYPQGRVSPVPPHWR